MTDIVERLCDVVDNITGAAHCTSVDGWWVWHRDIMREAADEITRLRSALSEAEKERDAARIWHSKAKTFLEELSDTRLRAENAEAELAKARTQCREMADDINVLRAELAQARNKVLEEAAMYCETHNMGIPYGGRKGIYAGYIPDFCPPEFSSRHAGMGYAAAIRALITDTVRTEGEQK